jgi:hypothetical protein
MIQVLNNFLPKEVFKALQDYVNTNDFQIVNVGEKDFSVLQTPDFVIPYLQINGFEMTLSFIRQAHKDFDVEHRLHADSKINGKVTHLARVLYLNNEGELEPNGTCFWNHSKYGDSLPLETPDEEFNRMLKEDAEDLTKWQKTDIIHARPNRLLTYEANQFHSKWPNKIEKGVRKILVAFYTKTNN